MRKILALSLVALLLPTVALGHTTTPLDEAFAEWTYVREPVILGWRELIETNDEYVLQELELALGTAIATMEEIAVDDCYSGWYTIARAEFELISESIRLSRLSTGDERAGNFAITGTSLYELNETLYTQARKDCQSGDTTGNTGR